MSGGSDGSRYRRLTAIDLLFLRLETDAWPCHFGGLAVVEGACLSGEDGELRIDELRDRLDRRVAEVPILKRRVLFPGPLGGGPIWVDDDRFDIAHHVRHSASKPATDDDGLLSAATEIYERPLDRSRPLWELWLLTGADDDRIGVLLKLHHAVADGLGAVAIMGSLFDLDAAGTDPPAVPWTPEPTPKARDLVVDNLSGRARSVTRALASLAHPSWIASAVRAFAKMTRAYFGRAAAAGSSLNQPVQAGRVVRYLRLDLETMRRVAHSREGKVNDVVLTLWAGGLRVLLAARGEQVDGVELITGMATTLRSEADSHTIDNKVGTMVLPLDLSDFDAHNRLLRMVATTRQAKTSRRPASTMGYLAGLAATPIGRYFAAHQTASNTIVTNVIGPPLPVYFLGARVLEVLPIIELVGNIGLTLAAFSYAGEMFMVVTVDAAAFPDVDVLMDGMARDWRALVPGPVRS